MDGKGDASYGLYPESNHEREISETLYDQFEKEGIVDKNKMINSKPFPLFFSSMLARNYP